MKIFYTYLWLREDGTPYYVGKGSGNRAFRKECPPKDRILIQEFPSEEDSFEAEKFLISYYGRKDLGIGILVNHTNGGEGSNTFFGKHHTKEAKEKISRARKGNKVWLGRTHSRETRYKLSLINKGKSLGHKFKIGDKPTEETRAKMRAAKAGKPNIHYRKNYKPSLETRKKMSDSAWQRRHIFVL